ncbi:B3 domain-containing protein At1g05920-like [Ziziphus jujuba]|uniref:B3 domain-containing protein At1g05920-like n=1 Tax=Ziziphus jujuba TaxID=326968 RepID=A0ABM3ZWM7_ZIZJJ|nr:B3 domain-containing protein At1g05920-like [Ziziphus jujuba]
MAASSRPRRCSKRSRTIKQEKTERIHEEEEENEEEEEEEGDDDGDHDQVKNSKEKQRKRRSSKRKRRLSNFVRQTAPPANPASYPELPVEFRREIEAMGGTDITLIMQKEVTKTDLKPYHNRLLMPFTKIIGDFLKPEEKATLRAQNVIEHVPLMMKRASPVARMELMNINMRQWDMHKNSGKMSSSNYVLRTSWKEVVTNNKLEEDDVVQIWSFRVQDRLHLALVVVARANYQLPLMADTNSTSGNNGSSGSSGNDGSGSGSSANTQIVEATPA